MSRCLTVNSLARRMVHQSQFIEMFGDPITNSKDCSQKKGSELFVFSSGKANTKANLNASYRYDCYGGNGTTGKSKDYLIDFTTLVIGRVGEYCGSVHITPTYSWITDNAIYIKEFKDKDLDINYLYYLFLFLDLHRLSAKTGQPKITQEALLGIDYICPSSKEQEEYVTFAQQADKSKFDGLKSQFIEMFGDPIENTKRWEQKRLNDLGTLERGVSRARPRNSPDLLGGPYPLVQTGEVANCETYIKEYLSTYSEKGLAQSKMWPEGTLCITIAANIAKTGILTFEACFPDSVVGFIPNDEVNLLFVHHWFKAVQHHLEELAPSTAQKNMNLGVLSNLKVISPPRVHQDRFASVVKQADKSKLFELKHSTICSMKTIPSSKC